MAQLALSPDMLSLLFSAVSQEFMLQPLNLTVLTGSNASFNATVPGKWDVMTWNVAKLLVLTITVVDDKINVIPNRGMFGAIGHSNTTVEFFIYNVTREQSGPIICTVQGEYGSREAQLNVQGKVSNISQAALIVNQFRVERQRRHSDRNTKPNILKVRCLPDSYYKKLSV